MAFKKETLHYVPQRKGPAEFEALLELPYDGATDVQMSMRKDNGSILPEGVK